MTLEAGLLLRVMTTVEMIPDLVTWCGYDQLGCLLIEEVRGPCADVFLWL